MEEPGARNPCLAGPGSSSPPPLFLPSEGRPNWLSSGARKKVRPRWGSISGPAFGFSGARVEKCNSRMPQSKARCVRSEAVRAPPAVALRLKFSTCNSAPFADEGNIRAGARSWRMFSHTRSNQKSCCSCKEEKPRESGSRMGRPPRPPQIWPHTHLRGRLRTRGEKPSVPDWLPPRVRPAGAERKGLGYDRRNATKRPVAPQFPAMCGTVC